MRAIRRQSSNLERGVVLIVVLIMLGVFSIIVVSMTGGSNINFRIAGNQQYRMEAKLTARNAVESYISNEANFALPLPTSDTYVVSDFDGDGTAEMTATVAPPDCLSINPIKHLDLDQTVKADRDCTGSGKLTNSGNFTDTSAALSGNSWCNKMNWDVSASVTDTATGVDLDMSQGVFLRAPKGTPCL